ncbi:hypothetical protein [Gimesia panareensis]|uniref:Uncharacterized protein n=1 Tax=Gimesia panareensis TaxID=2527978 RepID=A0A518ACB5_9PLAN|nr:hypothetical protein [Gimesia panareensis]QDT29336.1 hypothetical protein Enr10x_46880 [Gimesia panareensis]QDU52380.1 hypothetical protein Pan110_47570 [Gimesia panareensis]
MSILKIYCPEETLSETTVSQTESQPMILPFSRRLTRSPQLERQTDWVLNRARVLFKNQQCPACNSSAIEKLELRDGLLNRRNRLIPGTSTVVGFRCESCDTEWPA